MGDKEVCVDRESRIEYHSGGNAQSGLLHIVILQYGVSQGNTRVPAPGWNCTSPPET